MQSLHEAVSMNRPEEIDDLVRNGADVNRKDASGRTPFDMCALTKGIRHPHGEQSRLHTAGILLSHGANPNIADKFGWTMVHTCAWNDDIPLLKMCVRKGGKVNIANKQKQLPIDLASIRGNSEVVEYLEQQSCDIKAMCRVVIRGALGKRVHKVKELPLPPSLRLFVNYGSPYDGWTATLIPEPPWTVEQLRNETELNKDELKKFIQENASNDFLEDNSKNMSEMSELVDVFQSMYLWEAFKQNVDYEEPEVRKPRYSMEKVDKANSGTISEFQKWLKDNLLDQPI